MKAGEDKKIHAFFAPFQDRMKRKANNLSANKEPTMVLDKDHPEGQDSPCQESKEPSPDKMTANFNFSSIRGKHSYATKMGNSKIQLKYLSLDGAYI